MVNSVLLQEKRRRAGVVSGRQDAGLKVEAADRAACFDPGRGENCFSHGRTESDECRTQCTAIQRQV